MSPQNENLSSATKLILMTGEQLLNFLLRIKSAISSFQCLYARSFIILKGRAFLFLLEFGKILVSHHKCSCWTSWTFLHSTFMWTLIWSNVGYKFNLQKLLPQRCTVPFAYWSVTFSCVSLTPVYLNAILHLPHANFSCPLWMRFKSYNRVWLLCAPSSTCCLPATSLLIFVGTATCVCVFFFSWKVRLVK